MGVPDRTRPRHKGRDVGADQWSDPDNDGLDDWRPAEEDPSGPPGYMLPPGPKGAWPKYLRSVENRPPTVILNGCPRCGGEVLFRRRDGARWCAGCQRAFYQMSEDTVIRHSPDTDS